MKKKLTVGTVIQTFDENNKCVGQEFFAGDEVTHEDAYGNRIEGWDEYQRFDMVQPQAMAVVLIGNLSDGFGAVGPFTDSEEACRWADGQIVCLMTMQSPYEEFDTCKKA